MASFRSFSEIVSTMLRRLSLSQPNLDTKTGTVSRDLFVDLPADQIAKLYSALSIVSEKQSLATTVGRDLDRLGANFGASRSRGSAASGIVTFVTNTLSGDIPIPNGTIVTSRSGINFRTVGNYVMSASDRNRLAANASRIRKALNIAGLNSTYAIEVPIQAERPGTSGNVSSLQINKSGIQGVASVINLVSTSGGANTESDNSFRARILSVFSGANVGTSAGYRNALLGIQGVVDALVVEPGNSLMLRDGTETMALEDGTNRILSSGTGGKVDIYVLGRKIEAASESYIFSDLSGAGDIADERNDYILGQGNQDITRTSEERRVLSFKNGVLPAQPIDSVVSVVGSQSGQLTEAYIDENGIKLGHFELQKDYNPETGGSPFGFDKIHYISGKKEVDGEPILKGPSHESDSTAFAGLDEISSVYLDTNEIGENSAVSTAGSEYIVLNHTPVVRVSRVQNKTTGEIYSVVDQALDDNRLNQSGVIKISGKSLPSSSNTLSVNYTWRRYFDKTIDFSGERKNQFFDPNITDSIDWSQSAGIFEEEAEVLKSDDNNNYILSLDYLINKVLSVYSKKTYDGSLESLATPDGSSAVGVKVGLADDIISNIISIKRKSDGLELYNTNESDGYFSAREVYLPSDSLGIIDDQIIFEYNKTQVFNIDNTDGSFYKKTVVLPSEVTLEEAGVLDIIEDSYLSGDSLFVTYVSAQTSLYPKVLLSSLPITGDDTTNSLTTPSGVGELGSSQPVFYKSDSNFSVDLINKFGPCHLAVSASDLPSSGKIKVSGTSMNLHSFTLTSGVHMDGMVVNLESTLKEKLDLSSIPDNIGIAKINSVSKLDSDGNISDSFDVFGSSLKTVKYSVGYSKSDSSLKNYEFVIPQNTQNNAISLSSSDNIKIDLILYNTGDSEELFFERQSEKLTKNRYGRVESISVTSGFRNNIGLLTGSVEVGLSNQPRSNSQYFVDYAFSSPKEGERITVTYNVNKVILEATSELERVRPITADILVKEAEEILVDVQGTILVNDSSIRNSDSIIESVSNAVTNLLTTTALGGTVDYSDVISTAASQNGVDSVNISIFNENEKTGRKAFIRCLDNQFISPGVISFEAVSRNKFRIN